MKTTWNEMKEWCKKVFVFKTDGTSSDEPIGQDKDASVETKKKDKEQDLRSKLERYLWKRYDFRFNVLTEQLEQVHIIHN